MQEELIYINSTPSGYTFNISVEATDLSLKELDEVLTAVVRQIQTEYWEVKRKIDEAKK